LKSIALYVLTHTNTYKFQATKMMLEKPTRIVWMSFCVYHM